MLVMNDFIDPIIVPAHFLPACLPARLPAVLLAEPGPPPNGISHSSSQERCSELLRTVNIILFFSIGCDFRRRCYATSCRKRLISCVRHARRNSEGL